MYFGALVYLLGVLLVIPDKKWETKPKTLGTKPRHQESAREAPGLIH